MADSTLFATAWSEGCDPDDNRDAVRVTAATDGSEALLAVADGASNTLFAGNWAELLCDTAVAPESSGLDEVGLRAGLEQAAVAHQAGVTLGEEDRWLRRKWEQYGSQSTLLAVNIRKKSATSALVEAYAVGDSTLIHASETSVRSFPLTHSDEFGRRPTLISSLDPTDVVFDRWSGSMEPGDIIVAVSDGVARRLLELSSTDGASVVRALASALMDGHTDSRTVLVEAIGTPLPDGSMTLEDDATLALCVFLPPAPAADPVERVRQLLTPPSDSSPVDEPLLVRLSGLVRSAWDGFWKSSGRGRG